jgi:S1-C subfamily serine protease
MEPMRRLVVALVGLVLTAAPSLANDLTLRRALHAASVQVLTTGCSGALAENPQIVVTALHCLRGDTLRLRFSTGEERTGWVVARNEASDQAVLFLEDPVGIEPLSVLRRRQVPGTVLYFEGKPDRPRFQSARLDRIGRCPSLPDLPNALFTSIEGVPGDSGAPLVDAAGRVVGLVHGGAHCHIATPADSLARLVDQALDRPIDMLDLAVVAAPAAASVKYAALAPPAAARPPHVAATPHSHRPPRRETWSRVAIPSLRIFA